MQRVASTLPLALALVLIGSTAAGRSLQPTDPMDTERAAHTMTTLPDGRILVVGGFGAQDERQAPPIVFDPQSMSFHPLDSPLTWRHSHSATLLADGTVLLVGGYGPDNDYLETAEVFDPRTGRSRLVGRLDEARAGHVAVRLDDGRVLIAGGVGDGWTYLATAEIYDPAQAGFDPAGAMRVGRESHVAARLPDGRVLITGGHGGSRRDLRVFASTEIFDPSTQQFENAGSMTIRRHKHDAIPLDDGRVLILGGADERDSGGVYRGTEVFDPRTGRFEAHVPLQRPRYKLAGSTVRLDDGRFLISGGAAQPELYDPGESAFHMVRTSEQMPGLFSAAARMLDGRVLISGGYGNPGPATSRAWVFEAN